MNIEEMMKLTSENPEDFEIFFGDFLDRFYRASQNEKAHYVHDEPQLYYSIPAATNAFIAGAVEKLCNDAGIEPPSWVFKERFYLKEPMFSLNAKGMLKKILLFESPNEFVARNVFVPDNCLTRV